MMSNNRSLLSTQLIALEAASKEEDSASSPENTNRGKLDQELGDDMKIEIDDENESNAIIKPESNEDHTMKTTLKLPDIKDEIDDNDQQLNMNTNAIERGSWKDFQSQCFKQESNIGAMDVKTGGESFSQPSPCNSQAMIKPELKLHPLPNATGEVKKCSKLTKLVSAY